MKIETRWNVGDMVWGVVCDWSRRDVPCASCNGNGGALIPGTQIRVECQDCDGEGTAEKIVRTYSVRNFAISQIGIKVERRWSGDEPAVIVTYHFHQYRYSGFFQSVHETEDKAREACEKYAREDPEGELSQAFTAATR